MLHDQSSRMDLSFSKDRSRVLQFHISVAGVIYVIFFKTCSETRLKNCKAKLNQVHQAFRHLKSLCVDTVSKKDYLLQILRVSAGSVQSYGLSKKNVTCLPSVSRYVCLLTEL